VLKRKFSFRETSNKHLFALLLFQCTAIPGLVLNTGVVCSSYVVIRKLRRISNVIATSGLSDMVLTSPSTFTA
jgi:hypothetical protein